MDELLVCSISGPISSKPSIDVAVESRLGVDRNEIPPIPMLRGQSRLFIPHLPVDFELPRRVSYVDKYKEEVMKPVRES
jgi:hypothetical protein